MVKTKDDLLKGKTPEEILSLHNEKIRTGKEGRTLDATTVMQLNSMRVTDKMSRRGREGHEHTHGSEQDKQKRWTAIAKAYQGADSAKLEKEREWVVMNQMKVSRRTVQRYKHFKVE